MSDMPKQCIPKTQLNFHNDNKGSRYLAMLARIGLDSPTKSLDSGDSTNWSWHNQEAEFAQKKLVTCTLACSTMANLMLQGQQRLALIDRMIGESKSYTS